MTTNAIKDRHEFMYSTLSFLYSPVCVCVCSMYSQNDGLRGKKIQIKPPVTRVDNVKTHFAHTLSFPLPTIKTENL